MTDKARSCYEIGAAMFDGIGIRDKAFEPDGQRYSTYEIALWQIACNMTGFGEARRSMTIISYMQDSATGGVYTHYRANMLPDSQTNVETTSLAILADKGVSLPSASKPAEPPTSGTPSIELFIGVFIAAGLAVILVKRFWG